MGHVIKFAKLKMADQETIRNEITAMKYQLGKEPEKLIHETSENFDEVKKSCYEGKPG